MVDSAPHHHHATMLLCRKPVTNWQSLSQEQTLAWVQHHLNACSGRSTAPAQHNAQEGGQSDLLENIHICTYSRGGGNEWAWSECHIRHTRPTVMRREGLSVLFSVSQWKTCRELFGSNRNAHKLGIWQGSSWQAVMREKNQRGSLYNYSKFSSSGILILTCTPEFFFLLLWMSKIWNVAALYCPVGSPENSACMEWKKDESAQVLGIDPDINFYLLWQKDLFKSCQPTRFRIYAQIPVHQGLVLLCGYSWIKWDIHFYLDQFLWLEAFSLQEGWRLLVG